MRDFITFMIMSAVGSLLGLVIASLLGFTCRCKCDDHDDDNRY